MQRLLKLFSGDSALYAYRNTLEPGYQPVYALTRSIPFGAPFTRKLLTDLRLLGQKGTENPLRRVAVYISNDELNWYKLPSLHYKSAKFYRFLLMGNFLPTHTFSGFTAQIVERYTGKLR